MIPRSVLVNGVRYRVDVVPSKKLGGDDGECRLAKTRILLSDRLSPQQLRATYLHEVGHAAFYESGCAHIAKAYTARPDDLEEQLVQTWLPVFRAALGVK